MKTTLAILWLLVPALALPTRTGAAGDYTSETYGFTFRPPAYPRVQSGMAMTAMFLAPPEANFSANVNVVVESAPMTLDEHRKMALADLKKASFTVTAESTPMVSGRPAYQVEYEGMLQNRKMRWLALGVLAKDRVYLVTCTALRENFEHYEKEFRACLASFRLGE
jgi:hypothetical protein